MGIQFECGYKRKPSCQKVLSHRREVVGDKRLTPQSVQFLKRLHLRVRQTT